MADKYLLMETDAILAEFAEREEAIELMKFMRCWHPMNCYEIMAGSLE